MLYTTRGLGLFNKSPQYKRDMPRAFTSTTDHNTVFEPLSGWGRHMVDLGMDPGSNETRMFIEEVASDDDPLATITFAEFFAMMVARKQAEDIREGLDNYRKLMRMESRYAYFSGRMRALGMNPQSEEMIKIINDIDSESLSYDQFFDMLEPYNSFNMRSMTIEEFSAMITARSSPQYRKLRLDDSAYRYFSGRMKKLRINHESEEICKMINDINSESMTVHELWDMITPPSDLKSMTKDEFFAMITARKQGKSLPEHLALSSYSRPDEYAQPHTYRTPYRVVKDKDKALYHHSHSITTYSSP